MLYSNHAEIIKSRMPMDFGRLKLLNFLLSS